MPSTAQAQVTREALADPPANVPRTAAMAVACDRAPATGARRWCSRPSTGPGRQKGSGRSTLPGDYAGLTTAQQLFVLADIERESRGLPGFNGMSSQLDSLAETGASSNADPVGPDRF